MIPKFLIAFLILCFITLSQERIPFAVNKVYSSDEHLLATHVMSLDKRYPNAAVNTVFKNNILLTLAYLSGTVANPANIDWDKINANSRYELTLQPGQVFAFHNDVLPEFKNSIIKTTNAHFDVQDGFESDGYLVGDGVCHFASLINWAARDAGLEVVAPTNHDFAAIPEIAREYGTSIYYMPGQSLSNEMQNLYVKNTFDKPVRIVFEYSENNLQVAVYK